MLVSFKLHPKFEKIYKSLTKLLSPRSYRIIENNELAAKEILPTAPYPFVTAVASTSYSTHPCYLFGNHIIEKNSLIAHQRVYRYCEHDREPHLNADDYLYFVNTKGNVMRCQRYDNLRNDHRVSVSGFSSVEQIGEKYSLPKDKSGSITHFFSKGAILPEISKFYEIDNGDLRKKGKIRDT